jgi:hypothetical protein
VNVVQNAAPNTPAGSVGYLEVNTSNPGNSANEATREAVRFRAASVYEGFGAANEETTL